MDAKETLAGTSPRPDTVGDGDERRLGSRVSVSTELGLGLGLFCEATENGARVSAGSGSVEEKGGDGVRGEESEDVGDEERVSEENEEGFVGLATEGVTVAKPRAGEEIVIGENEDGDGDAEAEGETVASEEEEEEGREQEKEFEVGEFVWGKIKSHPWWPGQIYDPWDASDYAGRLRRRSRVLVAYFGDGTFAWCYPSQLRSFGADFERCSKQSSSKSFLNAVEKALEEFGRCVEAEMTCSCVEARPKLVKPFTVNAGIKEGVTVPEGKIGEHSVSGFEPEVFLAILADMAQGVSVINMLELTVLKCRLSAFSHAKGYGDLPSYYDPVGIMDPEESSHDHPEPSKHDEEDWLSCGVPRRKDNGSSLGRPEIAEDKLYHRKKQRSMAELMAGRADSDLENGIRAGAGGGKKEDLAKSASSSRKRKRTEPAPVSPAEEKDWGKTLSQSQEDKKGRRSSSLTVAVEGEKESDDRHQDGMSEEGTPLTSPRMRKKSKYLSPPYTMLGSRSSTSLKEAEGGEESTPKLSKVSEIGDGVKKVSGELAGAPPILKCSAENFQKKFCLAAEEVLPVSSGPRTPRAKEKKLSPGDYNVAPEAILSDLNSAALNPFFLGKDDSSDSIKAFLEKFRNSVYVRGSDYSTIKGSSSSRLKDSNGDAKGEGESGQKDSHGGKSSKASGGGTADHPGQRVSRGRKRKSSASGSEDNHHFAEENGATRDPQRDNQPDEKPEQRKGKSREEGNLDTTKKKSSGGVALNATMNHKEANGGGPAALLLTFAPGITFPSTDDLVSAFEKFGELNKSGTEVLKDLCCARVCFQRSSDAEKAFNDSDKISALKTLVVSYRLRYLSASSSKAAAEVEPGVALESMESDEASPVATSSPPPMVETAVAVTTDRSPVPDTSNDGPSSSAPLLMIKSNLETMMSTLTKSGEKEVNPEVRANLMGEISGLLQKVTKLVDSSSPV